MKILFVINSLSNMGGAEKVLSMIANYFASKKYDISILTLKEPESIFELHPNIKLITRPESQPSPSFLQQVKNIRHTIKTEKPSIVISFMAPSSIMTLLAAFFIKTPIILSEHTYFHRAVKGKAWHILRRLLYPLAKRTIILTQADRENYNFINNVTVLANPLILPQKHQGIEREKIILGVGRVHPVKGFDMLIEAFSKLNLKEWKLVIAGNNTSDYAKNLQKQTEQVNVHNNIHFVGAIKDIELYYKKASIYVLSSRAEGFPGTLCEAMGYGCPSIAFNCKTGPSEIIDHNISGLLVEANNVNALSEKISYLIENEEKRILLSEASPKIIEQLDINHIGQKWEDIVNSTVSEYQS